MSPARRARRRRGRATPRRPMRRSPVTPARSRSLCRRAIFGDANPILIGGRHPVPREPVFNPGAARVGDETILLVRVEDLRGISQLHVARSADGIIGLALRSRAAPPRRRRSRPRGDLGLRGSADHLAARARGVGDRLHGVQPARTARRRWRRRATSGASVGSVRSCRPRTRTRPCSRAGSTAAGR